MLLRSGVKKSSCRKVNMAVRKIVSLLIVAVLFAATSFKCASAFDPVPHDGPSGRKFLTESAVPRLSNVYFPSSFSAPVLSSAQQDRERFVDFTRGTLSEKLRKTTPPVGPAPGTLELKSRNTPAPSHGPSPSAFVLKPRNIPAPPHGPAPGTQTNWEVKTDQAASITIINEMGDEMGDAGAAVR